MASIVFIAVQCCQCSTMQVKQKKKSSNKWTCVVCNQNQSVRKIFAQAYKAKDLRKFVQSFNMSRKLADDGGEPESLIPIRSPQFDSGRLEDQQRKRRSDWSEYLDTEEDGNKENVKEEDEEGDDDLGIKIVTELPREMFKKPKLRNHSSRSDNGDGSDKLCKPIFSKRNANRHVISQEREEKNYQPEKVMSASKWSDYMMAEDNKNQSKTQPTMATKVSKWNAYINHDHDDSNLKVGNGRNFAISHDVWETILDDEKVEDDIHPDFI